jgi:hypothetical protein
MLDVIFDELLNLLFMIELVSSLAMFMVLRAVVLSLFLAMGVSLRQFVLYLLI